MGRVYAGWAMSHAYYRDEVWRDAGFSSLEDYLTRSWDEAFSRRDANDLLAQIGIWQRGDISQCPNSAATWTGARRDQGTMLLMPGRTDRYFDVRDNEDEIGRLFNAKSAELHPIPSIHGHRAGNPSTSPSIARFITAEDCGAAAELKEAIATMSTAITATGQKPLNRRHAPRAVRAIGPSRRRSRRSAITAAIALFGTLIWLVSSTMASPGRCRSWSCKATSSPSCSWSCTRPRHKTAFRSRALNLAFGHLSAHSRSAAYEYYCLFPLGPPSLHAGSRQGSGTDRLAQCRLGYATRDSPIPAFGSRLPLGLMLRHAFTGKVRCPGFPKQATHRGEGSAALRRLLCRCCCSLARAAYRDSALGLDIPLLIGQLILRPISMPSTPGVNGRAAPFRTPAPPTPA
jgi:hypothetical protein